ncbi:19697_t:CDS:2, partial [Cetraspora pellucida]
MYFTKLLIVLTFLIYYVLALPYKFKIYDVELLAPLISSENANVIPDQYIVIFKKYLDQDEIDSHYNQIRQLIAQNDDGIININEIRHTYDFNDFKGYAGRFSAKLLNKIRQSSEVDCVEEDQIVHLNYKKNQRKRYKIQYNPPWGLARISSRIDDWPSDSGRYWYHESGGDGVTVYIIDTGINIYHDDFEGRAIWGVDYSNDDYDNDGNGHGTHVAGIVAGKIHGVAKKATIVAVKVLNSYGYGYISDILKGIEWTVIQHKSKQMKSGHKGSVINMSLGGDKSIATNEAVNAAVREGIVVAVAAGNDNNDACNESPASAELAITVGASDIYDNCAWFSNHGKCVDIFAPGVDIESTWIGPENNMVATLSGTSMSSPHISGLCALFISMGIAKNPKDVKNKIIEHSTRDALKRIPNIHTPNKLGYNAWWWHNIFDLKLVRENENEVERDNKELVHNIKRIWNYLYYQERSGLINKSTFTHDILPSIMNFISPGIFKRWDQTQSFSAKGRGVRKFDDLIGYITRNDQTWYEVLFVEVPHGSFHKDLEPHIDKDKRKFGKL